MTDLEKVILGGFIRKYANLPEIPETDCGMIVIPFSSELFIIDLAYFDIDRGIFIRIEYDYSREGNLVDADKIEKRVIDLTPFNLWWPQREL